MPTRRPLLPAPVRRSLACAVLVAAAAGWARADSEAVSEHAVKAVLFYKLAHFVYLPDGGKRTGTRLCALGHHATVDALDQLARSQPEGRALAYKAVENAGAAARCDFLFIGRDEAAGVDAILYRLRDSDTVTVSDIPGFARAGGMVELAPSSERTGIQILINRKAAQRQGIEFSAQLLRLARIVEP